MTIDWIAFTPWSALGGGVLIGLAAALYVLFNGRVAGVSGVLGGLLRPRPTDVAWRLAFVAGLVLTPTLFLLLGRPQTVPIGTGYGALVLAGLLVGTGTRFGSGCTSGHGVCGVSRLSPRSMVATAAFMAAGFATVYVIRHLMGI
ncbi:MAG: YeeE/YedE family protein [Burkholderiaceae bacterium]|nr:MAG: YeeE/YedE family protein [Burkholderiaceae bacterium]TAM05893.1 MAG: YeeE/YedE family protein [Pusillimonas sp.]